MSRAIVIFLAYLNAGTLAGVVGLGLVRWSQLSPGLRLTWWALLSYLILLGLSILSSRGVWTIGNNLFIEYLIPALFGTLFAGCFALAVSAGSRRWVILGLASVGLIGLLIESIFQSNALGFSKWAIPFSTVLNTLITLVFLQYLLRHTLVSLLSLPLFWLSMGRLISTLTSTIYDALHSQLMASSREVLISWIAFQMVVMIVSNVFYGIGYWKVRN